MPAFEGPEAALGRRRVVGVAGLGYDSGKRAENAYWGPPIMNNARMARAAAAGCLFVICAAPGADAQMQGFGHGVAVNPEAVSGGSGLQMPGETVPGSTFYGLGAAPNAQRLPSALGRESAAADQTTGAMDMPLSTFGASAPFKVVEDSPEPPKAKPAPVKKVSRATASAPVPASVPAAPAITPPPKPETLMREAAKAPEPMAEPQPAPAPKPMPMPTPKVEPAPQPEPAELTPPKPAVKKASADIPPAAKPKAAPKPQPAAVETAAVNPKPESRPGFTRLTFGVTESKPDGAALTALRAVGGKMQEDEDARLEIRAYAGGEGISANRARRLSLARALAVRSQLIEQGVRSSRIDVRALGDKTEEKPFNRVDLALSSGGG